MKKDTRVAARYSAALFGVAERDAIIEVISSDIFLVETYIREVPYLRAVLMQPLVTEEHKLKILSDAFGDRITATTLNFLYLLVRKRREDLIDEVIEGFRRLADETANRITAHVTSAIALTNDQIGQIAIALEKRTGKTVQVTTSVSDEIIGGLLVRIGDRIIDGTIRGRIENVKQQLLGNH